MSKHKNLQPWLDYFKMLQRYEEKGFLELHPDKREAYITRAALLTLAEPITSLRVTQNLFYYLMYRAAAVGQSKDGNYAIHIVKEDMPHDLLSTIVLTYTTRPWWKPWMKEEHYEVIDYRQRPTVSPSE